MHIVQPSGTYAVYTKSAKAAADEAAAKKASAAKEGDKPKKPAPQKKGKAKVTMQCNMTTEKEKEWTPQQ